MNAAGKARPTARLHKFVWIDAFNKADISDVKLGKAKIVKCGNSLASKDNGDGFFCSRRELAERTGITADEAKKALSILRKHGWIRQVRRGGRAGNGAVWASEYVLTIPSAAAARESVDDYAGASKGEIHEVDGGTFAGQGGRYSPPIRPSSITPSTVTAPDAAVSAKLEEVRINFKEPAHRVGAEWRVQVWRCPACLQGGPEDIVHRTASSLSYVCSQGFLVEVAYTEVPKEDRGFGSHYQVAAVDANVDAILIASLANEV